LEVSKNQVNTPADCINSNPMSLLDTEDKIQQMQTRAWSRDEDDDVEEKQIVRTLRRQLLA